MEVPKFKLFTRATLNLSGYVSKNRVIDPVLEKLLLLGRLKSCLSVLNEVADGVMEA